MAKAMKLHLAISTDRVMGGSKVHITSTLCGRENAKSDDGTNSTADVAGVTCGHCLRLIEKPWVQQKLRALGQA